MSANTPHYAQAGAFAVWINSLIGKLARHGISLAGSAELSVRGRTSGRMQRIPVNPHHHGGTQYLVPARGDSQWVRNMRAAGGGELRVGRDVRTFTVTEVTDPAEKAAVLRTYLARWGWQVKKFFQGVTAESSEEELRAAAPDHPVFRLTISG
ncbi:nitroreductase/quinone reductase family protein [Streptomyces bambusae]|uniref:Nitroreductase family deazaflavin-dependent oxidoreductase n=1 Tax=Streptomyces bambusae TaxID=1550616 RepID=A0ABS6ZBK7_9ACTN|nr:nitroreductase/quinone reductase family protein [Streptomyces bambusae]MBW5484981.1 nitroreductase family deazaflavin-dependent oxidoreductase [Streptomyces bambusae]